jgi:short-subunit dehydrogenase
VNLYGRRVLLTGATGGIGHAIARALAARGARLVLTGRRTDVLEPLAAELEAEALAVDLSDLAEVDRLIEAAGEIDVLVANAALPGSGPVLEYTVDQIDRALAVNLRAPMVLARRLGEGMAARGDGHLAFIGSLSGKAVAPGTAIYSATKFGLRAFTLGLRAELAGSGVGVSMVFPGFIRDAGMFAEAEVELPPGVGTRSPQDVAAATVKAIEHNRPEVDVAPVGLRLGTLLATVIPVRSLAIQRRLGGEDVAAAMSEGQRAKR